MSDKKNKFHENFDRIENVKISTEKSFGTTFGIVFLLIGVLPLVFQHPARLWPLPISLIFFILTIVAPEKLKMLNLYWNKIGLLLNKIVSPVVLSLLFFLAFLPTGLLLKLFKKDILNLRIDKQSQSYWIKSETQTSSMKDQF